MLSSDVLRASRVAGAAQASGPGWRAGALRNRGAGNPARWARKRTATACCALRVFHPSARTARRPGARTGSRAAPRALPSAAWRLRGESHAVSAPGHATLGRQETHRTSDTILEPACVPVGRRGNAFYGKRFLQNSPGTAHVWPLNGTICDNNDNSGVPQLGGHQFSAWPLWSLCSGSAPDGPAAKRAGGRSGFARGWHTAVFRRRFPNAVRI